MPEDYGKIDQEKLRARVMELYKAKQTPEKSEVQRPSLQEREKVKEELSQTSQQQKASDVAAMVGDLATSLRDLDEEEQLGQLIEMLFLKGPAIAIRVAESLNKPDILDALHDLLASDNLYFRLIKENKL